MNETTQTENALVRNEGQLPATAAATGIAKKEEKKEKPPVIFDAEARNRLEFTVREGVKQYETAHVFEPISDDRYIQWQREFKIKGNEDNVSEEAREASVRLWDDIIFAVEKVKFPEDTDFRQWIPPLEKVGAIRDLLAVAISEDIEEVTDDRVFGNESKTVNVGTESFFNGDIAMQIHVMRPVSLELEKIYSRIKGKQYKQEKIGGLRNRKAKIEYVPVDDKFGELYDDMFVSADGFAGGKIPLRFKTTVVHHLFSEKLDQKKSQE
jgi:hypothetical protein